MSVLTEDKHRLVKNFLDVGLSCQIVASDQCSCQSSTCQPILTFCCANANLYSNLSLFWLSLCPELGQAGWSVLPVPAHKSNVVR